jgi:cation/acetate symporter
VLFTSNVALAPLMTTVSNRRLINPRLGTYFGIFASLYTGLVFLLLVFEQLGFPTSAIEWAMLLVPMALYVAIGVATPCREPIDFCAGGRRVPAVYSGLVLALGAIGGTAIIAGTGLFFINGYDAWCLVIGFSGGFVVMALVIAPYIRKFGAYTIPSYLGRRFENRLLRITAAAVFAVPMLLVAAAEIRIGAFAAAWLTGRSEALMVLLIGAVIVASIILGGVRSLTWTNTAQSIAALLALMVPVAIVASFVTNLPLPQLSHGPVLRAIGRLESAQGIPIPLAAPFAFDLAGTMLEPLTRRIAAPYGSVGPLAFILASLTLIAGVAASPWLLPRCIVTPSVYESRKAIGWATLFAGIAMVTVASVAVFMRDAVMDTLVGQAPDSLPDWFLELQHMGFAAADQRASALALSSLSFKRDAILFALPLTARFPAVLQYLALAGGLAAALVAASGAIMALANVLAEDGIEGLLLEPPPADVRLKIARLSIAMVTIFACSMAAMSADPLDLLLWALALSGSAAFPILVLSIWWKRLNGFGALVGMVTGFAVAVAAILMGEASVTVPSALAGIFGIPAGFAAAFFASWLRPQPASHVMDLVRDMRLPGGEAIYDREMRLLRLRRLQGH